MMIELQATYLILKAWKENPRLTKREIGVFNYSLEDKKYDKLFSGKEIKTKKEFLLKHNPSSYYKIFPEERTKK